jgi:hypothetical protein
VAVALTVTDVVSVISTPTLWSARNGRDTVTTSARVTATGKEFGSGQ